MTNQQLISKLSKVADNEMLLAEAYTWQSGEIRGKEPAWVASVLTRMATNVLLRATMVTEVLSCLGCSHRCAGVREGLLACGNDPAAMYRFDREKVRETIGLCEEVLESGLGEPEGGCLVKEVVRELCKEEESQCDMLGQLLNLAEHRDSDPSASRTNSEG